MKLHFEPDPDCQLAAVAGTYGQASAARFRV